MFKNLSSGITQWEEYGFEVLIGHKVHRHLLLALWPHVNYSASLKLDFLICKIGVKVTAPPHPPQQ